jgi:hypothetical protein
MILKLQSANAYRSLPFIASAFSLSASIASSKSRQESPFFSGSFNEQRPSFQFMQFFRSQSGKGKGRSSQPIES